MEDNENMFQRVKILEEKYGQIDKQINAVNNHFRRIEEKVNYIIDLLETLCSCDTKEDAEEYIDENNEEWLPELDTWKKNEE
jgi:prefoldin subunit 5